MLICASLGFSPAYRPTARPLQPSARSVAAVDGPALQWAAQHGLKVRGSRPAMGAPSPTAAPRQLPRTVPLTGDTLQAALKMRCDTSGASYAICAPPSMLAPHTRIACPPSHLLLPANKRCLPSHEP